MVWSIKVVVCSTAVVLCGDFQVVCGIFETQHVSLNVCLPGQVAVAASHISGVYSPPLLWKHAQNQLMLEQLELILGPILCECSALIAAPPFIPEHVLSSLSSTDNFFIVLKGLQIFLNRLKTWNLPRSLMFCVDVQGYLNNPLRMFRDIKVPPKVSLERMGSSSACWVDCRTVSSLLIVPGEHRR